MASSKYSVKDILAMTPDRIAKLSTTELRQVTQTLADAGNKRLKRLESADLGRLHPAVVKAQQQRRTKPDQPFFSLKGADSRSKLKSKFTYFRNWLDPEQTKTGNTLRGWRAVETKLIKELGGRENAEKIINSKSFWKNYRQIEEMAQGRGIFGSKDGRFDSETVLKQMVRMRSQKESYKSIMAKASDEIRAQEEMDIEKARNEFEEFES